MSSSKEHYHNKGEKDAADGNYEEPHGVLDSIFRIDDDTIAENKAYREGHANTRGQRDGHNNEYDPPSDPDARKVYDKARRKGYDER